MSELKITTSKYGRTKLRVEDVEGDLDVNAIGSDAIEIDFRIGQTKFRAVISRVDARTLAAALDYAADDASTWDNVDPEEAAIDAAIAAAKPTAER